MNCQQQKPGQNFVEFRIRPGKSDRNGAQEKSSFPLNYKSRAKKINLVLPSCMSKPSETQCCTNTFTAVQEQTEIIKSNAEIVAHVDFIMKFS